MSGPPVPPSMPSGLLKAGTVLLLVGAILHAVAAAFVLVASLVLFALEKNLLGEGDSAFPLRLVATLYLVLGVLLAAGAVVGFGAWSKARAGDARGGWVRGLVSSLLPPVQFVTLAGAVLCLVSPEGEAQGRSQAP